jgi:hypothetical protein
VPNKKKTILGKIFKEHNMQKFNLFISLLIMGLLLGSNADAHMMPKIYASGTLIVEEYPITRKDLFDDTFAYMKKREKWRISAFGLEILNRKFSSLGYHFVQVSPGYNRAFPGSFDFYQGNKLLIGGIGNIRGVSLDQHGKHFVFFASQSGKRFPEHEIVCIDGKIQRCLAKEKYDGWGQLGPAYVKNELVWCEVAYAGDTVREGNLAHWEGRVRNSKKVLFEFSFEYSAGSMPVRFEAADGYWLLQIEDGRVILNGEDLCKKFDYTGMWGYRFLKGKPFFFFTHKGDQNVRLSYNGKELLNLCYDFVGDNGGWTVYGNEVMVWFGATRGDHWYYVEAGIYE